MASIDFYGGEWGTIDLNGSGLGFFGNSGFGSSVEVGEYQDATHITDGNGLTNGGQVTNVKWSHANSGTLDGPNTYALQDIPHRLATLNIRFTHTSAVKTQNAKLRIYDRSAINNDPSGVTCKVADIWGHPHPTAETANQGSGDSSWNTPKGSGVIMDLVASPGNSGQRPNGANTTEIRHDWYVAMSASPDSIGSKTQFGLYVECEYL